MAEVILKNIKKVYPFTEDEKKKDKKDESESKPMNLQITDQALLSLKRHPLFIHLLQCHHNPPFNFYSQTLFDGQYHQILIFSNTIVTDAGHGK